MKIICDWENYKETGSYKAPVEKDNSSISFFNLAIISSKKLFIFKILLYR